MTLIKTFHAAIKTLVIMSVLICKPALAALSEDQLQIFVLHSYSQEYPWTKSQHQGFINTYKKNAQQRATFSTEYLDTKRVAYTEEYASFFASFIKKKYLGYTPDLIYITDDNATRFSIDKLRSIFPSTPVIFSGVNDYSIQHKLNSNMTGVFEKKDISENIKLLQLFDRKLKKIIVIGDASNTYQAIKTEIVSQLKNHPNIEATYISSSNINEITQTLKSQTDKYIFLTTIGSFVNTDNQPSNLRNSISAISKSGRFIIISMEDTYLMDNVLGGFVTSGLRQGQTAAKLALKKLQSSNEKQIPPVLTSPNEYIFNYTELTRNKIKIENLLSDSFKVTNKPQSIYERNREFIIGIVSSLVLLIIILMAFLLVMFSTKNKQILARSNEVRRQAANLQLMENTLSTAKEIAQLGSWIWNLTNDSMSWSDETYRILGERANSIEASYENLISFIHEDDRENIKKVIDTAIKSNGTYEIENRIVRMNGSVRYVRQAGNIHFDHDSRSKLLVGTLLDITASKKNELLELERLSTIERYQDALLEWSRVDYQNIEQAFEKATEISANTLKMARVSIWLYAEDHSSIQCQSLYIRDKGHEKGMELNKADFPNYFKALKSGKMIVVNNAREDERTNEFTQGYLIPNNIFSMLDAPILYAGKVIGVVCHEFTDTMHEWNSQEQDFASAIAGTVSLSLEIQKRRGMEKTLEHQAYHDTLTNLPNRSLFLDRLDQAIKLATRTKTLIAVLFLDLDNFKEINDSLGHDAGDQVLIQVAKKLSDNLRDMDTIARLGGDEFTLIMSSFRDYQHIHDLVAKLFQLLQQPIFINDQDLYATCSIGISIFPNDGKTSETLLRNADAAMYNAKEAGRNSFEFYTHDMTERAYERVLMETNLRRALDNEEFIIYYQPQYNARSNTMIGMEALLRWKHPEMGMVSPTKFIPVAEDTGLIVEIDRWVMQTATKQFTQWYQSGLQPGKLALNVSSKQLEKIDFADYIAVVLKIAECKPEWLSIEITESQIMKDPEQAVALLLEISGMGIDIAVDDFGTGYSSLTYLKRLPVDKLKIDRAFINELPDDEEDVAIVRAIIALSNSLKLSVIAEGVEKQEQVDFLLKEGCEEIQGFLFAKPMPADKISELLES